MESTVTSTNPARQAGERAEQSVFKALKSLPAPWRFFHSVDWRLLGESGEKIGEADAIVFHPNRGMVVLEIKAGAVEVRNGVWYYASRPMKKSPFQQARGNRYAIATKLLEVFGGKDANSFSITHAAWFPDVAWQGAVPCVDAPSRAYVLDKVSLGNPEAALSRLMNTAFPESKGWNEDEEQALIEILAPSCYQSISLSSFLPLSKQISNAREILDVDTDKHVAALLLLTSQKRLLIQGGAGSGKTALAVALAKEHAKCGRTVLFTCFNIFLAQDIKQRLVDVPGVTVTSFHDLAKDWANAAKIRFSEPSVSEMAARTKFFIDTCPDLLCQAADICVERFDTIIVDEAADFQAHWWVALEALGAMDFSWYCFYDLQQAIFQPDVNWIPPFNKVVPMQLTGNLRNTRQVGEFAAKLGNVPTPTEFRTEEGPEPEVMVCPDFIQMGHRLRQLLQRLTNKEGVPLENIVVLSHHRYDKLKSKWSDGLNSFEVNKEMVNAVPGKIRVGTIQGFKGLEADVVILAGLDEKAHSHPEWLYVGASRARVSLFVFTLKGEIE